MVLEIFYLDNQREEYMTFKYETRNDNYIRKYDIY